MLMYKDGITREVEAYEIQRFRDLGYVEVNAEASKHEEEAEDRRQRRKREEKEGAE